MLGDRRGSAKYSRIISLAGGKSGAEVGRKGMRKGAAGEGRLRAFHGVQRRIRYASVDDDEAEVRNLETRSPRFQLTGFKPPANLLSFDSPRTTEGLHYRELPGQISCR